MKKPNYKRPLKSSSHEFHTIQFNKTVTDVLACFKALFAHFYQ